MGWLRSLAFRGRDLPTSGPDIDSWGRRLRRFAARLSIVLAVSVGCLSPVVADHTEAHFGQYTTYQVVYQFNRSDTNYHRSVLFSISELIRKHGDDIEIVVIAIGPGLHILGRSPARPVEQEVKEKVQSLADYGVNFRACGNTMKSLGWSSKDLFSFVEVVPIGVEALIDFQTRGFAYISW